jgi:hypothetical protein
MKSPHLNHEERINVSISVDMLAQLFSTQQLCAADLTALDAESHERLRRLMLSVCVNQLKGYGNQCGVCASQGDCQQLTFGIFAQPMLKGLGSILTQ